MNFFVLFFATLGIITMVAGLSALIFVRPNKERRREFIQYVDFVCSVVGAPGKKFIIPRQLKQDIKARRDIEKNVQALLDMIFQHMGLMGQVRLTVVHSVFDSTGGAKRMGQFTSYTGVVPEIELILKNDHNCYNIAAVLAHESAHYYMHKKRIQPPAGLDEERMTDILAIHLGFKQVMDIGYAEQQGRMNPITRQVQTWRIGYIPSEAMAYIWRQCHWRFCVMQRKEKKQAEERERQREQARRRAENDAKWQREEEKARQRQVTEVWILLEHCRQQYYELCARAAAAKQRGFAPEGEEGLRRMQEIFLELEREDIAARLSVAEACGQAEAVLVHEATLRDMRGKLEAWNAFLA